jgi:hypothetical protein
LDSAHPFNTGAAPPPQRRNSRPGTGPRSRHQGGRWRRG